MTDSFFGFLETFIFEQGKITLASFMRTFSTANYLAAMRQYGETPVMVAGIDPDSLDRRARKLFRAIGVDRYARDLTLARQRHDLTNFARIEYAATSAILYHVSLYPWRLDVPAHLGSMPMDILRTHEMVCVGKSLLCHVFLETLGICHDVLNIPAHSALLVSVDFGHDFSGERHHQYYIDPTNFHDPIDISHSEHHPVGRYEIIHHPKIDPSIATIQRTDAHTGLMSQILVNIGNEYFREQQYDHAKRFYSGGIAYNPHDTKAHYAIGRTYFKLGSYLEARDTYHQSLKLYPANTATMLALGNLSFALGDFTEAVTHYEACIQYTPDDTRVWYNLGIVFEAMEYHDRAVHAFREVLTRDPDNIMARALYQRAEAKQNSRDC